MAWTVDQSTLEYRTKGLRVSPAERLARMKFYHMNYAASGSDGRYYADMLIALDREYCICWEAWLRQAALVIGGDPITMVMGVCPSSSWSLRPVDAAEWAGRQTGRRSEIDGSPQPHEALFLSDGPAVAGWPEPARLEDLQSGARLAAKVENRGRYGFRYQNEAASPA